MSQELTLENDITGLIACSQALGEDPLLVQGAGGNTSLKSGSTMWVKASGKWLARAASEDIFVPVDLQALGDIAALSQEPKIQPATGAKAGLRPSIETTLHAVLPHAVILHIHPVAVLALAVRADAAEKFKAVGGALVPYVKPGWGLAQAVRKAWEARRETQIFVLANHGLVVAAATFDEALALIGQTISICEAAARRVVGIDAAKAAHWLAAPENKGMRLATQAQTHMLALDPVCYNYCRAGVVYPDQAVFLGPSLVGQDERYRIVEGVGVFVAAQAPTGTEEMLTCHAEMLRRTPPGVVLNPLGADQVGELLNWDAEKFRQGKVS